jgi:SGNH hydrolase-like domain, acetyltransferase AlgX
LVRAADGRSVIIVTIPFKRDLLNLRDRGAPPLPAWFRQMSKDLGFTFVDLLPILAASPSDWESYYHECDHHWTAKANALVAEALAPVMEQVLATANARHNNH